MDYLSLKYSLSKKKLVTYQYFFNEINFFLKKHNLIIIKLQLKSLLNQFWLKFQKNFLSSQRQEMNSSVFKLRNLIHCNSAVIFSFISNLFAYQTGTMKVETITISKLSRNCKTTRIFTKIRLSQLQFKNWPWFAFITKASYDEPWRQYFNRVGFKFVESLKCLQFFSEFYSRLAGRFLFSQRKATWTFPVNHFRSASAFFMPCECKKAAKNHSSCFLFASRGIWCLRRSFLHVFKFKISFLVEIFVNHCRKSFYSFFPKLENTPKDN